MTENPAGGPPGCWSDWDSNLAGGGRWVTRRRVTIFVRSHRYTFFNGFDGGSGEFRAARPQLDRRYTVSHERAPSGAYDDCENLSVGRIRATVGRETVGLQPGRQTTPTRPSDLESESIRRGTIIQATSIAR